MASMETDGQEGEADLHVECCRRDNMQYAGKKSIEVPQVAKIMSNTAIQKKVEMSDADPGLDTRLKSIESVKISD